MSALAPKASVSAFFGNLGAASLILEYAGSPTSNKIMQKGLASARR